MEVGDETVEVRRMSPDNSEPVYPEVKLLKVG